MRSILITVIFLLSCIGISNAQLRTYLGIETGPSWDINRVEDPSNLLQQARVPGKVHGITLKQEVIPRLFVESGCHYHTYMNGIRLKDDRPGQASWPKLNMLLIPVAVSYKIQYDPYDISIAPRIGYQYGTSIADQDSYDAASLISDAEATTLSYDLSEDAFQGAGVHLLELGISGEYNLNNNWQLGLTLSHFSGFRNAGTSSIDVELSSGSSHSAQYIMDGSRIQTTARLSVPVSNIWENKNLRIRKRIENSHGQGRSSIRPQNYIYFGGDFGALWRNFTTSNPSVGALPVSGKGIFRYSNMHTGIYAGFLSPTNLGIDLGTYFQRSTLFFSLMYDNEVDFVTKGRAPFYLDIPIRIRYYYDLYKERFFLVPAFGVSVLTHFAGSGYGAGSDTFSYSDISGQRNGSVDYQGLRTSRIGLMLRAGIGSEYRVPIDFPLFANLSLEYIYGLREIDEIQVSTSINENPSLSTVKYMGTGWKLTFGARIPIILGKENRKCGARIVLH